jgi:phthalate 4,5-dioxygenase oxygenase subunit
VTTPEQNALLTQTGPGTPMGELFRCYWMPALLPEELPEPDCPPVRVTLLSERLLAFRASDGTLGLIDEFCAHRGVSLWFGRNEENGLRCPYHGWKYDTGGQCVEVPSEPAESGYAQKIKLKSYPLIERGGVLWTYMGPPESQPALPEFEFATVGPKQRFISKRLQECNYLQALEGGIDSSHTSFLHRGSLMHDPGYAPTSAKYNLQDFEVKFDIVESDGGMLIGARRKADNDNYYWRITQWVMPAFTAIPPRGNRPCRGHFWIPIDDEHCWTWSYDYHPMRDLSDKEVNGVKGVYGRVPLIPGTYIPVQNKSNDYLMDRAAQKSGIFYSGVEGIAIQDSSLQESMGGIQDRTKENLVGADNGIIMVRNRLRKAALALQQGVRPGGLDPVAHRVRSVSVILPQHVALKDAPKEALIAREGVPLTSV